MRVVLLLTLLMSVVVVSFVMHHNGKKKLIHLEFTRLTWISNYKFNQKQNYQLLARDFY